MKPSNLKWLKIVLSFEHSIFFSLYFIIVIFYFYLFSISLFYFSSCINNPNICKNKSKSEQAILLIYSYVGETYITPSLVGGGDWRVKLPMKPFGGECKQCKYERNICVYERFLYIFLYKSYVLEKREYPPPLNFEGYSDSGPEGINQKYLTNFWHQKCFTLENKFSNELRK